MIGFRVLLPTVSLELIPLASILLKMWCHFSRWEYWSTVQWDNHLPHSIYSTSINMTNMPLLFWSLYPIGDSHYTYYFLKPLCFSHILAIDFLSLTCLVNFLYGSWYSGGGWGKFNPFCSTSYVPSTSYAFSYLLLTILRSRYNCPQFIDIEAEAQTSSLLAKVTCLKRGQMWDSNPE